MKDKTAQPDYIGALEIAQPKIEPESPQLEALLTTGYGMSIAEAKKIIAERDANPQAWPLEEYRKAQAMLAAFAKGANRRPSSTRQPWRIGTGARIARVP